ncbi:prephenate dehydratase, partial [Chlamydiota bacterium]
TLMGAETIERLQKIYSNPQVFGQCRIWLRENVGKAELIEVSSTAKAAEYAGKEKQVGAIASLLAAKIYNLPILAESIEDFSGNVTRFLVIGKKSSEMTGHDKTSIMFSIKDRIGALYEVLLPFKRSSINLTKIESRPSKKKAWDYYFYVDFMGHCEEEKIKNALQELQAHCVFVKILGSYPIQTEYGLKNL